MHTLPDFDSKLQVNSSSQKHAEGRKVDVNAGERTPSCRILKTGVESMMYDLSVLKRMEKKRNVG